MKFSNAEGESRQLMLFPSDVRPPDENDPNVARVLINKARLERLREFGACDLGLDLWKRLKLDVFFQATLDHERADVVWSRIAALRRNRIFEYRTGLIDLAPSRNISTRLHGAGRTAILRRQRGRAAITSQAPEVWSVIVMSTVHPEKPSGFGCSGYETTAANMLNSPSQPVEEVQFPSERRFPLNFPNDRRIERPCARTGELPCFRRNTAVR